MDTSSWPLPCNRVLGIQELQDLIRARLLFRDLKTCTLVCRYWNSLFGPYLWTRVDMNRRDRGKMTILRRHGNHVAALDFVHADKRTFKFIRTFCPQVHALSLVFDDRSSWVSYRHLEKFFRSMPQTTSLDIRFDACYFSPAMFWCLSQLPNLTSLTIDVFYEQFAGTKHYAPDAFMTILDCCPHLLELTDKDYNIRRLNLRSPHMDDDVFCLLTTRCPLLEDLILDGVWIRTSNDTWREISIQCPRLRSISVRNSGSVHFIPNIQTLMTIFPRLESLSLMALEFSRDPDLSDLDTKLQELETENGDKHPLKQIHLSGSILNPLKVVLDIVTQSSMVESLSVGFTLNTNRQHDPHEPLELERRWLCQDTLTHLDLTSISFPDRAIFTSTPDLSATDSPSCSGSGSGHNHNSNHNRLRTSFFCFPALESLRVGMACYLNKKWFEMPVIYEEVVYMIHATPLLKRLELKHMSESGVIKRLAAEYPKIEFS
ncbi:hypothetical protein BGX31_009855 [Mortierella sp. GBA43]|nr:hypothetical protein BGX31_009855 [Mortierella sp. GBA43]